MKFREKYPLEPIRYLGWKQPFASLMLHGKIETRTWDAKYRGWVLITASKSPYRRSETLNLSGDKQYKLIEKTLKIDNFNYKNLPMGRAIAIGYLNESRPMGGYASDRAITPNGLHIEDQTFVKINYDLWLHEYIDVQPIEPFEMKGAQGWRKLDEETIDKIILINP